MSTICCTAPDARIVPFSCAAARNFRLFTLWIPLRIKPASVSSKNLIVSRFQPKPGSGPALHLAAAHAEFMPKTDSKSTLRISLKRTPAPNRTVPGIHCSAPSGTCGNPALLKSLRCHCARRRAARTTFAKKPPGSTPAETRTTIGPRPAKGRCFRYAECSKVQPLHSSVTAHNRCPRLGLAAFRWNAPRPVDLPLHPGRISARPAADIAGW